MAKLNRVIDNNFLQDPSQIVAVEYNPASGGQKALIVGPRLLPIPIAGGWTTTPTAATALPYLGANIAVYNNASAVGSIVIGGSTIVTLAPGVVDGSGNVGVACPPNAWTYLSMSNNQYVITSAATLLVYIMEDPTRIAQETGAFVNQFVNGTQLLPSS
jgi:hypothetical protein